MKKYIIATLFVLVLLLAGLNYSKDKKVDSLPQTVGDNRVGFTLGLTSMKSLSPLNFTHLVSQGKTYEPEIYLLNKYPIQNSYRLFFILDYSQTDVIYKGKKINYLDINLEANSDEKISIEVPGIKTGLHDFMVWSIRNPNENLTKKEFIPPTQLNIYRRVTLIAGDSNAHPEVTFHRINTIIAEKNMPLIITESPRSTIAGEVATIVKGTEELWFNFSTAKPHMRYCILAFLDTKQVQLRNPCIETNSEGVVQYPIIIQPENHKNKNLSLAVVENPFMQFEIKPGETINESWSVQFGNKITVETP